MLHRTRLGVIAAAVAVVALAGPRADAQGGRGGQRQARRGQAAVQIVDLPTPVLDTICKLTPEQKTKVDAVREKLAADLRALRPAKGAQPDPAAADKRKDINKQASTDLMAILTDDQKDKLKAAGRELAPLRASGIPMGVVYDLKLTDDQKKQIAEMAQDLRAKVRALPAEERRAKMREMVAERKTKVEELLTAEQKEVMKKWIQENQKKRGRKPAKP